MSGTSKNSKTNRGAKALKRMLDGVEVNPVKYTGPNVSGGRSTYMTGSVDSKIVEDANGIPLPLKSIGAIV